MLKHLYEVIMKSESSELIVMSVAGKTIHGAITRAVKAANFQLQTTEITDKNVVSVIAKGHNPFKPKFEVA